MDTSVLAIGLLLAFVGVIWAAMVLWGLICPPVAQASERRAVSRSPNRIAVSDAAPMVRQQGDDRYPIIVMPDAPAIAAVALPDDDKVVSLSEWRERHERVS